jgi:hypothetical protein
MSIICGHRGSRRVATLPPPTAALTTSRILGPRVTSDSPLPSRIERCGQRRGNHISPPRETVRMSASGGTQPPTARQFYSPVLRLTPSLAMARISSSVGSRPNSLLSPWLSRVQRSPRQRPPPHGDGSPTTARSAYPPAGESARGYLEPILRKRSDSHPCSLTAYSSLKHRFALDSARRAPQPPSLPVIRQAVEHCNSVF